MPGGRGPKKKTAANPGAARSADGGYAPSQPVRPIPAENHGDRQASVDLQQAAPLAAGGAPTAVPPSGPPPAGMPAADPFGPSRRPDEPLTAGAMLGPGNTPNPKENVRDLIGALYEEFGLDELLDMLEELDEELAP